MIKLVSDQFREKWDEDGRSVTLAIQTAIEALVPGASLNAPVHLKSISKALGVDQIIEQPMESHDGFLATTSAGRFNIIVNSNRTPARKRFTIAHELGHLIVIKALALEVSGDLTCNRLSRESRDEEKLCDIIASEILIPEELFKRSCEQRGLTAASVSKIGSDFGVSSEVISRRIAKNLSFEVSFSQWYLDQRRNHYIPEWYIMRKGRREQYSVPANSINAACFEEGSVPGWYWSPLDGYDEKLFIDVAKEVRKDRNIWLMMCISGSSAANHYAKISSVQTEDRSRTQLPI